MMKQTDAYIIGKLSSTIKSDRQEAMGYLFQEMYKQVKHYIQKNSGSASEVDDVFQDSLIALYKHACAGKLGSHIRLQAYFFTICKNLWRKELLKKGRTVELTEHHDKEIDPHNQESIMVTEDRKQLLDELISRLGPNCYQLLKYYYYEKRKMKEIASLLSLTNEQAAKDKKASCMKKLRALVQSHPHLLEMLK